MVAMHHAIYKRDPDLLSLSLNGPIPKASDNVDKAWDPVSGSLETLPQYIKSRMHAIEESGDFESEEMQEIHMVVFHNFYSRNGIFADCAFTSFLGNNEEVYVGLWGTIDYFNMTGTLASFDLCDDIGALKHLPVLLTTGEFHMVRPIVVHSLYKALPLSERFCFQNLDMLPSLM